MKTLLVALIVLGAISIAIAIYPSVLIIIAKARGNYSYGGVPRMRNPPPPPPKRHENIGSNYQPTIDNTTQPPK